MEAILSSKRAHIKTISDPQVVQTNMISDQ
jgi:hypothetical protein